MQFVPAVPVTVSTESLSLCTIISHTSIHLHVTQLPALNFNTSPCCKGVKVRVIMLAKKQRVSLGFLQFLLTPIPHRTDFVVANLPFTCRMLTLQNFAFAFVFLQAQLSHISFNTSHNSLVLSVVHELLTMLYAHHGMMSASTDSMLDFFEANTPQLQVTHF